MTLDKIKNLKEVVINCYYRKMKNQSIIEQFEYDRRIASEMLTMPLVSLGIESVLCQVSIDDTTWYVTRRHAGVDISKEMPAQWLMYLIAAESVILRT